MRWVLALLLIGCGARTDLQSREPPIDGGVDAPDGFMASDVPRPTCGGGSSSVRLDEVDLPIAGAALGHGGCTWQLTLSFIAEGRYEPGRFPPSDLSFYVLVRLPGEDPAPGTFEAEAAVAVRRPVRVDSMGTAAVVIERLDSIEGLSFCSGGECGGHGIAGHVEASGPDWTASGEFETDFCTIHTWCDL